MIPLLKRHLSLSRGGITIKGVDTRGTNPQSGCKHAEDAIDIGSRTYWSPWGLAIPPSLLLPVTVAPIARYTLATAPGALTFPWGDPTSEATQSLWVISVWRASSTSHNWSSSRSQTFLVSSIWDTDVWASESPSLGLSAFGRGWAPTPIPWTCIQIPKRWLYLAAMYSLTCQPFGGRMQSMTDSPHQTVAAMRCCIVAIKLASHLNPRITSMLDSMSIPSRCPWPTSMHNSSMFSSLKELEHHGVTLPQVATKTQIQLPMSISSPRVGSTSAKAFSVDGVNMLVWKSGKSM